MQGYAKAMMDNQDTGPLAALALWVDRHREGWAAASGRTLSSSDVAAAYAVAAEWLRSPGEGVGA